jgi:hypothetical protein
MHRINCNSLVASYIDWLRKGITVAEVGDACEITTPFLDRHNDRLQIYVKPAEGGLRLTDDGYIISDLEISGCPLDTAARRQTLKTVLSGFGVQEQNGELSVLATVTDFAQKKHQLLQAMLAVNDMFMISKPAVTSLFVEDVQAFLDANDIRYLPAVEFTGQSGFLHKFDFVIPKSKMAPERLIRAVNHPTKQNATNVLFAVADTKKVRPPDSQAFAFLNDNLEAPLKPDVITAFSQYDVAAVRWSDRQRHVAALKA